MKRKVMMGLFTCLSFVVIAQPDNPATPAPLDEFEIVLLLLGSVVGTWALLRRIRTKQLIST
ncbi:hypothetical protein [Phaeocystidibacter luteus]|uniref:PEP-CTERM sorting domain-containing protein n=1 Tax=Phaeocystidibacter luteus TaxID=911197 RepID=A0A6N6RJA7_9FLAO|nr:hypothetical protein [Phaeocystidibacter luteus]KAB2813651.1 hypothetical protein F8C67_05680 [Phaeocystidibacter luteus]